MPQNRCPICGEPLLARYDLERLRGQHPRPPLDGRPLTLWRYEELLPVEAREAVMLGERMTPTISAPALSHDLGLTNLLIKDEGVLPTGSFKARGAAVGVSRAAKLGIRHIALPTAGNAGAAWAAYGARAGMRVAVAMPDDAPAFNKAEAAATGQEVITVQGNISDAARELEGWHVEGGYFMAATFNEPYRVEGKKTIAFELAEQLGCRWPSAVVYPTGGAVGLIGIWKAVRELAALGWVTSPPPRMVAVQAEGCAPIVDAFEQGQDRTNPVPKPHTVAPGIRVPSPLAGRLALSAIRESNGIAVKVSDAELLEDMHRATDMTGIFFGPEGAATISATRKLLKSGWLKADDQVVLLNTGSGLKHLDLF